MKKFNKLLATIAMAGIFLFPACSEKEVPVPTVNTERLDDLRNELRDLRILVYGEQWEVEDISAENTSIEAQISHLETEIQRLRTIYEKSVIFGLYLIDFQNNKLSNATVKLAQNGEVFTGTTDENGYIEFAKVRSGMVAGVIEKEGYTTANFTSKLEKMGYSEDTATYRFSKVALFPSDDNPENTGKFLLKGHLFANFSLLDDTGENQGQNPNNPFSIYDPVAGIKIRFSLLLNNIKSWSSAFINVHSIIYEGTYYETTTKEDGSYEIYLPSRGIFFNAHDPYYNSFGFLVLAEEFQADFTYPLASDKITERRTFSVDLYDNCYYYDLTPASLPGDTRTANFFYQSYKN